MINENELEQEIKDKGLVAPRLTPAHIDACIVAEDYHVFPGTTNTVCLLTLKNGYTTIGDSACASPENFDAEIGRKLARDNARNKIWALEGYLLKHHLHLKHDALNILNRVGVNPDGKPYIQTNTGA